jgi:hypothetical protein
MRKATAAHLDMHLDMAASRQRSELDPAARSAFPVRGISDMVGDNRMRRSVRRLTFAAATLAIAFVPGIAALSAEEKPQTQAPDTVQQDIPDHKIDAAAAAMQQVASLKQAYQQRYETASPSEKDRIADEANAALSKVVTDKGLSVEEYSAILMTAQNDPVVRGKILERIRTPQQ